METRNTEITRPEDVEVIDTDKDTVERTDASDSGTGSGNGVAVNAAGSKITLGVSEVNNSRGNGAQISNVQGDINFGNVTTKRGRFDNLPPAPEPKQLDTDQEFSR